MNWKIFVFKAQVTADIPFDAIVEFIKRRSNRGTRFKFRAADKNEARIFYAYRQGIYGRLGYWDGSTAEVIITNKLDDKVVIDFTFPNSVLIAYGLIAIFIFAAGLFIPGLGVWGSVIILLAIYFGVVIRLIRSSTFSSRIWTNLRRISKEDLFETRTKMASRQQMLRLTFCVSRTATSNA